MMESWYEHQISIVNKRNAELEAQVQQLREALKMMIAQGGPLGSYGDAAFNKAHAALAATEPK
jgi:hypothetical protein